MSLCVQLDLHFISNLLVPPLSARLEAASPPHTGGRTRPHCHCNLILSKTHYTDKSLPLHLHNQKHFVFNQALLYKTTFTNVTFFFSLILVSLIFLKVFYLYQSFIVAFNFFKMNFSFRSNEGPASIPGLGLGSSFRQSSF